MKELVFGIVTLLLGIALAAAPWALHHIVSAVEMTSVGASAVVTAVFGAVLVHDAIEHRHGRQPRS